MSDSPHALGPALQQLVQLVQQLTDTAAFTFIFCPGGRNYPLLQALKKSQGPFSLQSVGDERTAGFMALGLAKAGRWAAIMATSGSAAAHFFPAVVEAQKEGLRFLMISADRPGGHQRGDFDQTTRQASFFAGLSLNCLSLDLATPASAAAEQGRLKAFLGHFQKACGQGPFHLNLHLPDPVHASGPAVAWGPQREIGPAELASFWRPEQQKKVALIWGKGAQGQGFLGRHTTPPAADVLSCYPPSAPAPLGIEQWLRWQHSRPDWLETIVHLGGRTVNRDYQRFLETFPGQVIQVAPSAAQRFLVREHFLFPAGGPLPWEKGEEGVAAVPTLADSPLPLRAWSEASAVDGLFRHAKTGQRFFLANSLSVRLADLTFCHHWDKKLVFYANRGANGIDGQLATALGLAAQGPLTVIMGDQSFFHEGIETLRQLKKAPVGLVVLNNFGGQIFHQLPTAGDAWDQEHLFQKHEESLEHWAKAAALRYRQAKTLDDIGPGPEAGELLECVFAPRSFGEIKKLWFNESNSE